MIEFIRAARFFSVSRSPIHPFDDWNEPTSTRAYDSTRGSDTRTNDLKNLQQTPRPPNPMPAISSLSCYESPAYICYRRTYISSCMARTEHVTDMHASFVPSLTGVSFKNTKKRKTKANKGESYVKAYRSSQNTSVRGRQLNFSEIGDQTN